MTRTSLGPWISLAARLLLGGVLVVAGVLKAVLPPTEQVRAVRAYDLLPVGADAALAYALPFAEILVGLALIVGFGTRVAAAVGGALMLVFVAGIISVWVRGLSIDCGCFGGGGPVAPEQTAYLTEILRDAGLAVAAAWLVVFGAGRLALDRPAPATGEPGDHHPDTDGPPGPVLANEPADVHTNQGEG